jgi:hypothetical protein
MRRTVAGILLSLGSLWAGVARGQTFPTTYAPLYCQRGLMVDGYRDQNGAVDERDLVGTVAHPAGFHAVDGQFLYLRLRLDASPMQGNGLSPFAWGFELSTDGDPTNYEILISVDGASGTVRLYRNSVTTNPDSPEDPADELVMSYPFAQNARLLDAGASLFGGGSDTFVELAVPWSDLQMVGLTPGSLVTVWAASSTNPDRLNGDFACHDGAGGAVTPRLSQIGSASVAPDPGRGPGPVGGPSGSVAGDGNLLASSGIEGGPGCSCDLGAGRRPGAVLTLLLLGAALGIRRSRARRGPA